MVKLGSVDGFSKSQGEDLESARMLLLGERVKTPMDYRTLPQPDDQTSQRAVMEFNICDNCGVLYNRFPVKIVRNIFEKTASRNYLIFEERLLFRSKSSDIQTTANLLYPENGKFPKGPQVTLT
jgi:hypothetical protein